MTFQSSKIALAALLSTWAFIAVGCSLGPGEQTLQQERVELAEADFQWLSYPVEDLPERLTLDDIVNIASQRNLELYVQEQAWAIQREKTTRDLWALLPQMNYNNVNTIRNKNTASKSELVNPPAGSPPVPYDIGVPKREHTWNLSLLWNVLDFGITYLRAQQEEDKAIIQSYEYERVRQSVILRSVQAYWRAVAAKKALERADALIPDMLTQTKRLNRELKDKIYLTKDQALAKLVFFYQREIELKGFNDRPDSSDPTQGYAKEYENALLDLIQLMQLPPGTHFDLAMPEDDELPYESPLPPPGDLFAIALSNRPELYERDMEVRIGVEDVYIAMVEQLPGLQLFYSQNHESNRFLLFKNWYQAGINVAWNLFAIPARYTEQIIGRQEEELAIRQRLLQSEAILTQVALTYLLFQQNQEQYLMAIQWAEAAKQVAILDEKERLVGKMSKLQALQSKIDAALAFNNATKIYAELQNNLEQLNNAIGLPRYYRTEKLGLTTLDTFEKEFLQKNNSNDESQDSKQDEKNS